MLGTPRGAESARVRSPPFGEFFSICDKFCTSGDTPKDKLILSILIFFHIANHFRFFFFFYFISLIGRNICILFFSSTTTNQYIQPVKIHGKKEIFLIVSRFFSQSYELIQLTLTIISKCTSCHKNIVQ